MPKEKKDYLEMFGTIPKEEKSPTNGTLWDTLRRPGAVLTMPDEFREMIPQQRLNAANAMRREMEKNIIFGGARSAGKQAMQGTQWNSETIRRMEIQQELNRAQQKPDVIKTESGFNFVMPEFKWTP